MKKKLFFITFLWLSMFTLAQTPQAFKYQTVARSNAGEILASQSISFRMTIVQGELPGTVVYTETHAATTNATGLATLEIGRGTPVTGSFATINWGTTPIFLKTEIDPAGGTAFIEMGTSELLSVPYSFYAKTAGNGFSGNYNDLSNKPALWDSTWLTIKNKPTTVAGYGITDAMTSAHAANGITTDNIANWNTTFGWGNHAAAGYLTGFTEIDPIFGVHPAKGITSGNITNWNTAFGWGNHATAGYLTSFTETDPIFGVHPASGITSGNISNWNTAFGWGNHASAGYLTNFTETDPVFGAWDKSTGIAITESQISDLKDYLTEELDADPANELQTVTQNDYNVALSQGGGSFMTGVKTYTQPEIDALTPYNGLTVHNSTTNCINYYFINNWFEACGTCTPMPSQSIAGDDQSFTDNTLSAILTANTPEHGTGLWTIVSGEGGVINDASNPSAAFTGIHCTDYLLSWTITNSCGSSSDNVTISFFATPTEAFAGNDTVVEGGETTLYLSANTPEFGEGLWSVISGEGGTFVNATNPNTLFTGQPNINYVLQWQVYTTCDYSFDEVTILFADLFVGLEYQGGIIAYILQPGDPGYIEGETHGLIAAPSDYDGLVEWGCVGASIGTSTELGSGEANTAAIVAACSSPGIAAKICDELELNSYNDWYLPSKVELDLICQNKSVLGVFISNAYYWSSSEYSDESTNTQYIPNCSPSIHTKSQLEAVRAVRSF